MCNNGCILPQEGFLEGLRHLCDKYHIALIFDEVITGFRLSLGGAQQYFGFTHLDAVKDYRDTLTFDRAKLCKFIAAMHDKNIRIIGRGLLYISAAHTDEDIEHTIEVSAEVLSNM